MTSPRCPAKSKTTGKPCALGAGHGTTHRGFGLCKYHGGNSPGGTKQGQRLMAAASAQAFGLPVETTADEALEAELWRTVGTVAWLGEHLQEVPPEQRLVGAMASFAELYGSERRHLTAVSKACIDAGLDKRKVALLERTATAFAEVLRRVLSDLDVLNDPRAPIVVQRHLALLTPGGSND